MKISDLETADSPKALEFPHFPARWQAVVWRNWGLIPAERLAQVLKTTPENLRAAAAELGLNPDEPVQEKWCSHSYLSVLRCNWHLLSIAQLLELLDWSGNCLLQVLNEEDFFWSKVGRLKPATGNVCYSELSPEQKQQTAEIRAVMKQFFSIGNSGYLDAPFAFMNRFQKQTAVRKSHPYDFEFNFIHSFAASCGDIFLNADTADPVPENLLQQYASMGVQGVWMHALLRHFYPVPGAEEYSCGRETRLNNLKKIVERCGKYGLGVYLYFNEPRFMPRPFYDKFPQWAGWDLLDGTSKTICTNRTDEPLQWLENGMKFLFSEVKNLAGLFCITMSENPTHCNYSSMREKCPYCKDVPQEKIIADIVRAMERGVHSANPEARFIAFDWSWRPNRQSEDNAAFKAGVIRELPESVSIASVSEWGMITHIGGVRQYLKDYSISQPGPSGESRQTWEAARKCGLKTVAKVQLNNSWELSAVPYIPVPYLVQEHLRNLQKAKVSGLILSWTLGGYPGGNLQLLNSSPEEIAVSMFHPELAEKICRVWKIFSEAFREFPFHNGSVLYRCPENYGPMNLLHLHPTGFTATMLGFPYDDLESWRGPYPEEILEAQFEKLTIGWKKGLAALKEGEQPEKQELADFQEIVRIAEVCCCHWRSTWCQIRFIRARNHGFQKEIMIECLHEEIELALHLHELVRRDSRFGFEASNHYYYSLNDLREKVISCNFILKQLKQNNT